MSLLGRLEDLSLTDIVQIVFLSRRTGVLEIVDQRGRHTVLFRQGLVVNASSPEYPDLCAFLESQQLLASAASATLRKMETKGIPVGTAAIELNLISRDDLAEAIRKRIISVVTPLLESREGEFNFILSDTVGALDAEYDSDSVFKEGGLSPQRILGGDGTEKIKPLKGLEDSLRAGKALLRGTPTPEPPPSLNLGLGQPATPAPIQTPVISDKAGNVLTFPMSRDAEPSVPFADVEEELAASSIAPGADLPLPAEPPHVPDLTSAPKRPTGRFKVAGGLFEVESPEAIFRNVVVFERNPLIRVAARRAFTKQGVKIAQFGSLDDVRRELTELFRANSFFVTFLELTEDDAAERLMLQIKRKNPRLPIVIIDGEADLRRRHDLLRAGADLYLTKPSAARLQPGLADEELALFADELVLFAERAFNTWEHQAGNRDANAGKRFYETAQKESLDRSFVVLRQLINELSNPNDIGQVAATILRLSGQYLERGALFMASQTEFVGLGGFGMTGGGEDMESRVRRLRFARGEPSLLNDVSTRGEAHRGKMRRTPANVELIDKMGGLLPTEVVALPITHAGRTIGILYGDNAEHRAPIDTMTGLEIFLSQAGYAFGNAVFASEKAGRG
ncbi:MAG: response regulator [Acidobacteriota bacterium]